MTAKLQSVHRKNAAVLALAVVGAIPYGWAAVLSVALGGGIQVFNLHALDRTVSGLRDIARSGTSVGFRVLLVFRFLLVVAAVGFALLRLPVEPLAFVVGLGTVIPAVIWHGLETARRLRAEEP